MSDDEFEEALSWEPMDVSQDNAVDSTVVPLDRSEDAQFSEQQYNNIQDRLTRINRRIIMANTALAQLQQKIRARVSQPPGVPTAADNLAGGDNPFRGDETETGEQSQN
ncbi:uncharacterized protein gdrd [Drosophila kikkawai]|uniref:Uncharacterized protein gdrd n=1 Tax=Drosophila kikkawai TaxID=30033 RepID=A0A6P4I6N7_DROKI|nr:uncharacterized protein LOC108072751 [Drosophila kikkawai]KAH8351480.1 hypothetical protein KR059_003511 [Drosophila kikkawai]